MTKSSTVITLPRSALPEIKSGSVHSPGQLISGSRNEVWLCPAYCGAQSVMLYVKPRLTLRQVVAELVVAQVAKGMGLPCPQPYLVVVRPNCVGRPPGPVSMAFGSEQVGARGLATPIRDRDLMLEMLKKLKVSEGTAVLDEMVANDVRGPGDVVFDPAGAVWLIDHEGALARGLEPDEAVTNWLGDRLRESTQPHERDQLLVALRAQAVKVRKLQLKGAPTDLALLNGATDSYRQVLEFLENRLHHLDRLLSQRALPEQRYLTETPETHDDTHETDRAADV